MNQQRRQLRLHTPHYETLFCEMCANTLLIRVINAPGQSFQSFGTCARCEEEAGSIANKSTSANHGTAPQAAPQTAPQTAPIAISMAPVALALRPVPLAASQTGTLQSTPLATPERSAAPLATPKTAIIKPKASAKSKHIVKLKFSPAARAELRKLFNLPPTVSVKPRHIVTLKLPPSVLAKIACSRSSLDGQVTVQQ